MDLLKATTINLTDFNIHELNREGLFNESVMDKFKDHDAVVAYREVEQWLHTNLKSTLSHSFFVSRIFKNLPYLCLVLISASQKKEIENPRYNDLKEGLNSIVQYSTTSFYDIHIATRTQIKFEKSYLGSSYIYSLHELKSSYKKLIKYENKQHVLHSIEQSLFPERLKLYTELMVLARALDDIKNYVVPAKRKPNAKKNDNQSDQHICGYCFRAIRLKPKSTDLIAYHGFVRDDSTWMMIDGSCEGANKQPLEISPDATMKLFRDLTYSYNENIKAINSLTLKINELEGIGVDSLLVDDRKRLYKMKERVQHLTNVNSYHIPSHQSNALKMLTKYHPSRVNEAEKIIAECQNQN